MIHGAIIYQIIYSTRSSEDAAPAASFSIRISNPNPNPSKHKYQESMLEKVWEHMGRLCSGEKLVRGGTVTQAIESWIESPLRTDYRTGVQQQGGMFKGEARHR